MRARGRPTFLVCLLASAGLAAEPPRPASFATADGGTVFADVYGNAGHEGVVLAHGAAFSKESWRSLAEQLAAKGFRVLAIDFRGWGKSTGGAAKDALFEDVLAAVRYLRRGGAARVSVVGASMGGGAAAILILSRFLPRTSVYQKLVSQSASGVKTEAAVEKQKASRQGQIGMTISPLRPGGKAQFGDEILDVISQGDLVAKGTRVRIIGYSGTEALVEVLA